MFVDEVRIFVKAGRGGDGACSFRREKYVPRGGPDGGDGGHGGDVVLTASSRLTTLLDLRYQQQYAAEDGEAGGGSNCTGKRGGNVILAVPVGTVVYDDSTSAVVADLVASGDSFVGAHGGRGGRGNSHFATSTNRVPTQFETGTDGEERWLRLELKLLADVGLVGFPNAGKSTLIAAISAARPKIADYPFTTLHPQLGVVRVDDAEFVLADIPGLIEGAHEGAGLGHRFLGHVERCGVLIHLVDVTHENVAQAYKTIRAELKAYSPVLAAKPEIVVLNKCDALVEAEIKAKARALKKAAKVEPRRMSGATGKGVREVMREAYKVMRAHRAAALETATEAEPAVLPRITPAPVRAHKPRADKAAKRA